MAAAATKAPRTVRMTDETKRLLGLLAAFEGRAEGDIFEDAVRAYVTWRSLEYGNHLPEARALTRAAPEESGVLLDRLLKAIETAMSSTEGQSEPLNQRPSARELALAHAKSKREPGAPPGGDRQSKSADATLAPRRATRARKKVAARA